MTNKFIKSELSRCDSFGQVYFSDGAVYRVISEEGKFIINNESYRNLLVRLEAKGLFVKTHDSDIEIEPSKKVVEHELIAPFIAPTEWSFEHLRRAAICVLKSWMISIECGYTFKDCHGLNVMFRGSAPLYVDIGSLIPTNQNCPEYPAIKQFMKFYFVPLMFMAKGRAFAAKSCIIRPDFISLSMQEIGLLFFIRHPSVIGGILFALPYERLESFAKRIKLDGLLRLLFPLSSWLAGKLIESLLKKLQKLSTVSHSRWTKYHDAYAVGEGESSNYRYPFILNQIISLQPESVVELAGNSGVLSYEIATKLTNIKVLCTDYDDGAISKGITLYGDKVNNLCFACFNFMEPHRLYGVKDPALRFKGDVVIALAVTHHLLLSQRYDYTDIFNRIFGFSNRYVLVEFMPLGLWYGKPLPPLPLWYSEDKFRSELALFGTILGRHQLETNRILYIVEKSNSVAN
jgi:hypothetical protein